MSRTIGRYSRAYDVANDAWDFTCLRCGHIKHYTRGDVITWPKKEGEALWELMYLLHPCKSERV